MKGFLYTDVKKAIGDPNHELAERGLIVKWAGPKVIVVSKPDKTFVLLRSEYDILYVDDHNNLKVENIAQTESRMFNDIIILNESDPDVIPPPNWDVNI